MQRSTRIDARLLIISAVIAAFVALFGALDRQYLSGVNLQNVLVQASYLVLFASAQMLALIVRGLDLSIGFTVSVVSVSAAMVASSQGLADSPVAASIYGIAVGLAAGALIGAFNGFGVAVLRVNAFVVTLASLNICLGISSMLSDGKPVPGIPTPLSSLFYQSTLFGLPIAIVWSGAVLLALHLVLTRTLLGRNWYAIGSSIRAATLAGVPVRSGLIWAYVMCSVCAALGALLLTARTGSGEPNLGGEIALQSIAAAAIGGVSLRGGVGGVANVIAGALFITVIANGMNFLQVNGYLQQICMGVIIVAAATLDRRVRAG